ncbi:FkbM family methyltransferase [Pseudomonas sp. Fl5BN2]|uniref:FkbM family methyltransferase n=1 Tax=Pseudomonas sp. Fl5BN2 TaxID=2697652 RepID=UPI0013782A0C|nr:FkbM family methyltransferase [Pseudomonas sp. Fl5BN2]NBF03289.1 FkbM family methyltransferase [Pseudomonas sp. Fl5BN2]
MSIKNYLRPAVEAILKKAGLLYIFRLRRDAIKAYGWERSATAYASIDAESNPIPWITYPAIDFLASRVNRNMKVFEYGSGNSTLWWAKRVGMVSSVEHDFSWHEKVKAELPENANLKYIELSYDGDYCRALACGQDWNIIVVDGRDRVNCLKQSIEKIANDGVILLDNSDRDEYKEGIDFLLNHGYRKLEFRGLAPIVTYISETSIFYKPDNCLGL